MVQRKRLVGLTWIIGWLTLLPFLAACVPAEVEPSLGGGLTAESALLIGSPEATPQLLPTPFPSATWTPTPGVAATDTPTVVPQGSPSPTWDISQGLPPVITPTPVPPPPGLVYSLDGRLWQIGEDWQPLKLAAEAGDRLSAGGQRALRVVDDDIWLILLPGGQLFNLTGNTGRLHCCPQFWPGRPETIVFGSWSTDEDLGPSTGYLSSVNVDLSDYRVLDDLHQSNAGPAPGPDGRTIAYDRAGTAWLYDWEDGPRALDPVAYGLNNVVRIAGPSWSPDGQQLAWTVAITDPEWRIALAVFDLEAGTARLFHPYENAGRGGWFPPPTWSPDGRWLAFLTEDADQAVRGVYLVEVGSGAEIFAGAGVRPLWSPDGRWLLVSPSDPDEMGAWLTDLETGYSQQMFLPPGAQAVAWLR
jgi:hypothetical protein